MWHALVKRLRSCEEEKDVHIESEDMQWKWRYVMKVKICNEGEDMQWRWRYAMKVIIFLLLSPQHATISQYHFTMPLFIYTVSSRLCDVGCYHCWRLLIWQSFHQRWRNYSYICIHWQGIFVIMCVHTIKKYAILKFYDSSCVKLKKQNWYSSVGYILIYFECVCLVFQKYSVRCRQDTFNFLSSRFEYVGRDLTADRNSPAKPIYNMITDWALPLCGSSLYSFVGLATFSHRYDPYLDMHIK